MSHSQWTAVDRYFNDLLLPADPALDAALAASAAAGLPSIQVAPNQGKLLSLIARACNAKRILEVGTLGGYSTIWLARALPPGGRLITIEADPLHAEVAGRNVADAGLAAMVDLRLGRGLDVLPKIAAEGHPPFDFTFIDADKPGNWDYCAFALKLSRPGSLIVVDNVVRGGAVADRANHEASVEGVRRFAEQLAAEPRLSATTIQTVGEKGYDGLTFILVKG